MKRAMAGVLVAGCATSYHDAVKTTPMSDGTYVIGVETNRNTDSSTAMSYAYRRASELCPGGYTRVDGAVSQRDRYVAVGNTAVNRPDTSITLVIRCGSASSAPTRDGFWCFDLSLGGSVSSCSRVRDTCEASAADMKARGEQGVSRCEWQPAAVCFSAINRLTSKQVDMCSGGFESCALVIRTTVGSADWNVVSTCGRRE